METRSLCIAPIAKTTKAFEISAFLFYENSTGGVSALSRNMTAFDYFDYADVTHQRKALAYDLYTVFVPNSLIVYGAVPDITYGAPFACPANFTSDAAVFYSAPDGFVTLSDFSTFFPDEPSTPVNYSSLNQSDVALFGSDYALWINGTQPASFPGTQGAVLPDHTFPFARLASAYSVNQAATFLYHQMNGTTFAEEQWDNVAFEWTTSAYFTVSDS